MMKPWKTVNPKNPNRRRGNRLSQTFKNKQVIIARSDLKMSPGKLAVQVAHGSIGAAEKTRNTKREWFDDWIKENQKKVVVKVSNEKELRELHKLAKGMDLPCDLIQDAGLTELTPGTITVLAVGPAPNDKIDKLTGDLPLW